MHIDPRVADLIRSLAGLEQEYRMRCFNVGALEHGRSTWLTTTSVGSALHDEILKRKDADIASQVAQRDKAARSFRRKLIQLRKLINE